MDEPLALMLIRAIAVRAPLLHDAHNTALRLFSMALPRVIRIWWSIYIGRPRSFIIRRSGLTGTTRVQETVTMLLARLPWLRAIIVKTRHSALAADRRASTLGATIDRQVCEHGVWYAVDLLLNRDASLYLDTRNLRAWVIRELRGKTVLNTFAYTGSIGVAALAGGATQVTQLSIAMGNSSSVAKASYALNHFPVRKKDFLVGDFLPPLAACQESGRTL